MFVIVYLMYVHGTVLVECWLTADHLLVNCVPPTDLGVGCSPVYIVKGVQTECMCVHCSIAYAT